MRTTVLLSDQLGSAARRRAQADRLSFSAFVARAIEEYLSTRRTEVPAPPFKLVTVGGGGPFPGIDLDRTSALLTAEDEAAFLPTAKTP